MIKTSVFTAALLMIVTWMTPTRAEADGGACQVCKGGITGVECVDDKGSRRECIIRNVESTCTFELAGEGNIQLGLKKLGANGGLKGKGLLKCVVKTKCELGEKCEMKGGKLCGYFDTSCAAAAAMHSVQARLQPDQSIDGTRTDTYYDVEASTAQWIVDSWY